MFTIIALNAAVMAVPVPSWARHRPHLAGAAASLLHEAQPSLMDPTKAVTIPQQFADQGVVELYHLRYERIGKDGLSWQVNQRVFDIRSAEGVSVFGVDDLWYDGSRTRFVLDKAQVIRDGKVVAEGRDGGDSIPGATGNRSRRLVLPPLQPGDRVNIVYLLTPVHAPQWTHFSHRYLGDLFAFRGSYPVVKVDYSLHATQDLAVSQDKLTPPVVEHSGRQWSWQWTGGPYAAFFQENDGPSITDSSPFVQVSSFHSWAELAAWYNQELQHRADISPEFRRTLLQLVPPQKTPLQTVGAVWTYLSAHLQYHGVEEGVHAYVPSPVETVFQSGRGDCKDGSLLLTTWLRAEGIPAYLALVRTRPMGTVADGAATMAAFDHAIVTVPSLGLWIDTTVPDFRVPELPSSDQDGLALIVRPGENELTQIPLATAEANLTRRVVHLKPQGDGWYAAHGVIEVRGADAPVMRRDYGDAADRKATFQSWLRDAFPQAELEQVAVHGMRTSGQAIRIQFSARVHPTHGMHVAWTPRHYARVLAMQARRSEALQLPLRWVTDETWDLDTGNAASCPEHMAPRQQNGPFGSVAIDSSCTQGHWVLHTRVEQSAAEVTAQQYGQFQSFWRQVDTMLNAPVPLKPATTMEAEQKPPSAPDSSAAPAAGAAPGASE